MSQSAPTTPPPNSAPTPLSERALAPDLARGVMLLFIALANAIVTWAATVVLADRLRAAGRRGPFETLTRQLTYGRSRGRVSKDK